MYPSTILAKIPREVGRVQDVSRDLLRVTELFEARKPKQPAVLSEIAGEVEVVDVEAHRQGKRLIVIKSPRGHKVKCPIPTLARLRVRTGDMVVTGEPLTDGPINPHDILHISGEEEVQHYLLQEIQNVYHSREVNINDKHIEIILAQMMRCVQVVDPGDTDFLPGAIVDKFLFRRENERISQKGKKTAFAKPKLLGITKATLYSESFISAASFQETKKVLVESALASKIDPLRGLTENALLGYMIPAGTGFKEHLRKSIEKEQKQETEGLNRDCTTEVDTTQQDI